MPCRSSIHICCNESMSGAGDLGSATYCLTNLWNLGIVTFPLWPQFFHPWNESLNEMPVISFQYNQSRKRVKATSTLMILFLISTSLTGCQACVLGCTEMPYIPLSEEFYILLTLLCSRKDLKWVFYLKKYVSVWILLVLWGHKRTSFWDQISLGNIASYCFILESHTQC